MNFKNKLRWFKFVGEPFVTKQVYKFGNMLGLIARIQYFTLYIFWKWDAFLFAIKVQPENERIVLCSNYRLTSLTNYRKFN